MEEREFLQGCRHLGSLRNQWSFFYACRPVSIMLHAAKSRKEVFMIGEDGVLSRPFFGKGIMQFVCTALRFFRSYGNMK